MTRPPSPRRSGSAGDLRYLIALGLTPEAIARRIGRTANAVRDEIYREDQAQKEHDKMMRDYVKTKLAAFMRENTGKTLDLTGSYGGQSPDLAAAWMGYLSGRPVVPAWHAKELIGLPLDGWRWNDVASGQLPEPGDLLVWGGEPGSVGAPYGHVAIFLSADEDLFVFDQSPTPCGTRWHAPIGLFGWHSYVGSGL